jgi:hypothetical protein
MDDLAARQLGELMDREQIRAQLTKYCRALDRLDAGLLLEVYHPEAIDDHAIFIGDAAEFATWVMDYQGKWFGGTQHVITNTTIELDGDVAHTETYWISLSMCPEGEPLPLVSGRYVDRFERRHDRVWKIAARKMIPEWGKMDWLNPEVSKALAEEGARRRDRQDVSYMRPLRVRQKTVAFERPN